MNALLNIYTTFTLIAIVAMIFFIYKVKMLLPQLSASELFGANLSNRLTACRTVLLYLFCPLLHIFFIIIAMYFLSLNYDKSIDLIRQSLKDAKEREEKQKHEKNDNQ